MVADLRSDQVAQQRRPGRKPVSSVVVARREAVAECKEAHGPVDADRRDRSNNTAIHESLRCTRETFQACSHRRKFARYRRPRTQTHESVADAGRLHTPQCIRGICL